MNRIIAAALITLVTSNCTVSQDQEIALGQQTAEEINSKVPIIQDPAIADYVQILGDSIAKHTDRADLTWHFYVVDSDEVNAFALPGGFIYVNRGLIERAPKMDQLAGALGHEIGHVVRRHSVEQMKSAGRRNIGIALVCTLTSICQGAAGQVAIRVGGTAIMARHSRKDETEADQEAVANVLRVGIDPRGIPELFANLLEERKRRPGMLDAWFATHPLEESRITDTQRIIEEIDPGQLEHTVSNSPDYAAFRARLMAMPAAPKADTILVE